jgi:hypothetical protein
MHMPHSLAARPRFAQGERAIASLVGALTLLVATFAISGSAGATTGKIRAHAAANHAGKHDPGAEAGDQAKNDKKAEDNDAGDENQPPGCDSSYSAAGETHCPPVNQACPVADEGQGNVDEHLGDEAQNDAKAHDAKAKAIATRASRTRPRTTRAASTTRPRTTTSCSTTTRTSATATPRTACRSRRSATTPT